LPLIIFTLISHELSLMIAIADEMLMFSIAITLSPAFFELYCRVFDICRFISLPPLMPRHFAAITRHYADLIFSLLFSLSLIFHCFLSPAFHASL